MKQINKFQELLNDVPQSTQRYIDKQLQIATQLTLLIEKNGITKKEIEQKLNIKSKKLKNILSGVENIDLQLLTQLEELFDEDIIFIPPFYKQTKYPNWIQYFIGLAFVIAQRSKDVQTKHGCVITDFHNHIIGTGYNSFPHNMMDETLPNIRPEKYNYVLHAEENAISNCVVSPWIIPNGAKAFITGQPCNHCAYLLWQNNIKEWYIANRKGTQLETEKTKQDFELFIKQTGAKIYYVDYDLSWIKAVEAM